MKRNFRARFINVGKDSPEFVDKIPSHGKVFTNQDIIRRQLLGIPDSYTCPDCGSVLSAEITEISKTRIEHEKTQKHQTYVQKPRAWPKGGE